MGKLHGLGRVVQLDAREPALSDCHAVLSQRACTAATKAYASALALMLLPVLSTGVEAAAQYGISLAEHGCTSVEAFASSRLLGQAAAHPSYQNRWQ